MARLQDLFGVMNSTEVNFAFDVQKGTAKKASFVSLWNSSVVLCLPFQLCQALLVASRCECRKGLCFDVRNESHLRQELPFFGTGDWKLTVRSNLQICWNVGLEVGNLIKTLTSRALDDSGASGAKPISTVVRRHFQHLFQLSFPSLFLVFYSQDEIKHDQQFRNADHVFFFSVMDAKALADVRPVRQWWPQDSCTELDSCFQPLFSCLLEEFALLKQNGQKMVMHFTRRGPAVVSAKQSTRINSF